MNWTNLWNRLRGLPANHEADLDDELAFHTELKRRELERNGMPAAEAVAAARRSLGNLTLAREQAREAWAFVWLSDLWRDVQYGARTLRAQPGFTLAATLALSLGIGLNGILFTVYNAMALAPWAIRDAANCIQLAVEDAPGKWRGFSWPEYQYLRENARTVDALVASDHTGLRIRAGAESWKVQGVSASANFFDGIGTGFALGRGFSPGAADALHPAPEVVLHHDTWRDRFGGAPETVGQWIEINGRQLQIVGVAAAGFSGPTPTIPHLWLPAAWTDKLNPGADAYRSPNTCCTQVIGHLRAGQTRAQAQAELETLSRRFRSSIQRDPGRIRVTDPALLASPGVDREAGQVFVLLGIAAALILLLACANVANLQLARAQTRRREIAVRLSLGAARGRILRQLLAESVLLALLAGLVTFVLCQNAPAMIISWIAPSEERIAIQFHPDWRVAAFLIAASFGAGLLFGLAPALSVIRDALASGLREGGRTAAGGRLRIAFLVAQVAVCATVLGGATLLIRALHEAGRIDPGFRAESVIVVSPNLLNSGMTDSQSAAVTALLAERLRLLPGVEAVAASTIVPLGNTTTSTSVERPNTKDSLISSFSTISANYLATLYIPLIGGRDFTASDETRADVVIINEALAKLLFPGSNPVGQTIAALGSRQVIAVVRNSSTRELSPFPAPHFYVPSRGERGTNLLVRHSGPAAPLLDGIPKHAQSLDSRVLAAAAPLRDNVGRAKRAAAIAASLATGVSLLALLLASIGIYGVAAYQVAQRTREIGVRMALGARPGQIIAMVLRQNLTAVAIGAIVGLGGALALGQLLRSLLYGVSPADPAALVLMIAILAGMATFAALPNARRAASIAPASGLRHD